MLKKKTNYERADEREATQSVASNDAENFLLQSYWKTEQHHNSRNIDFSYAVLGTETYYFSM